jgi:hypothetical protein
MRSVAKGQFRTHARQKRYQKCNRKRSQKGDYFASIVSLRPKEHSSRPDRPPTFSRAPLASALGYLGEIAEAQRIWRELTEINPKYSFSEHFGRLPFKRQEDVQRIVPGSREGRIVDLRTRLWLE